MDFYRNVSKPQYSNGKSYANMAVYNEQARKMKEERLAKEKAALESSASKMALEKSAKAKLGADKIMLEGKKRAVIAQIHNFVPLSIMAECFSTIMIGALPHDTDYIEANRSTLEAVSKIYLHHIGGVKLLKEQASKTGSLILKRMAEIVKEDSEPIVQAKIDEIRNAESEEQITDVLNSGINADQAQKVADDISSLNPEEISSLVQNKVVDVVKDEVAKEQEEKELRAELKARANDSESESDEEAESPEDGESDEANNQEEDIEADAKQGEEEVAPENNESEEKSDDEDGDDEVETENAKLAQFLLNPQILHEHTLFYSMMHAIYSDMIANESVASSKKTSVTLESNLNLNDFDRYLNDYQGDFRDVDVMHIGAKEPLGSSARQIEAEDVLAEALAQYTLLETAMTLQLISPTATEVRKMAEFNMRK